MQEFVYLVPVILTTQPISNMLRPMDEP